MCVFFRFFVCFSFSFFVFVFVFKIVFGFVFGSLTFCVFESVRRRWAGQLRAKGIERVKALGLCGYAKWLRLIYAEHKDHVCCHNASQSVPGSFVTW